MVAGFDIVGSSCRSTATLGCYRLHKPQTRVQGDDMNKHNSTTIANPFGDSPNCPQKGKNREAGTHSITRMVHGSALILMLIVSLPMSPPPQNILPQLALPSNNSCH